MEQITFRTLRNRVNLTSEFIANELGIKLQTYNKYERSDRLPPNKKLIKLKVILNCNDDDIMKAYTFHKKVKLYKMSLSSKRGI